MHGNHTAWYFGALFPRYAHLQVLLIDRRSDQIIGRGRTIPFRWDGTLEVCPRALTLSACRPSPSPARPRRCPRWPPRSRPTTRAAG